MSTTPPPGRLKLDFSATGRARVIAVSILVTLACSCISVALTELGIVPVDPTRIDQQLAVNIIAPVFIAFPVMFFVMTKMRELATAHRQLTAYASTDGLTKVMTRAAFSTLVEAYLTEIRRQESAIAGALLIIDADNFKTVNDRYGHDWGDEALVTIATSISTMLRAPEIVGRLGGEEFGVFLPGADFVQAGLVAERIRRSVSEAPFAPAGAAHRLSVSVGGAAFVRRLPFSQLFRLADQQLYVAKRAGRNRIAIAPVEPPGSLVAA